jgi:hypothetical protein
VSAATTTTASATWSSAGSRTLAELFHEHAGVVGSTRLSKPHSGTGAARSWRVQVKPDLPLPFCARPAWMERFVAPGQLFALLLPFVPFLLGVMVQNPTARLLFALVAAPHCSGLLHFLTLPFAVRFPAGCTPSADSSSLLRGLWAVGEARVWHRGKPGVSCVRSWRR